MGKILSLILELLFLKVCLAAPIGNDNSNRYIRTIWGPQLSTDGTGIYFSKRIRYAVSRREEIKAINYGYVSSIHDEPDDGWVVTLISGELTWKYSNGFAYEDFKTLVGKKTYYSFIINQVNPEKADLPPFMQPYCSYFFPCLRPISSQIRWALSSPANCAA